MLKRKLIEVALPLQEINKESAREKSIRHGHPSTLHLWWARRPLAACRAVLFASLVDDPSSHPEQFPTETEQEKERERLFAILRELVQWEKANSPTVLEQARREIRRSTGGNPPPVYDPFCGGGSIPLEAQRLGLEARGSDLNPVAVLITKALIEIPPKFAGKPPVNPHERLKNEPAAWSGARGLAADVRYYGQWMRTQAEARIGHLYPRVQLPAEQGGGEATVIAWLWARTVRCPNPACGAEMPLVRSFSLSTKKGREVWVEPIVDPAAKRVRFEVKSGKFDEANRSQIGNGTAVTNEKGKRSKAAFRCIVCGVGVAKGEYIDNEASTHGLGALPLAVVTDGRRERVYIEFNDLTDRIALREADVRADALDREGAIPRQQARGTFASNAQGRWYGFDNFGKYFTPRQLVALTTFSDLVQEARSQALADGAEPEYGDAIATYLEFALDKCCDYWNSIASWAQSGEFIRNLFARQAIPMTWDFAEGNPFSTSTANWSNAIDWVALAMEQLPAEGTPGKVAQSDACLLNLSASPMFSTDPPYYDNIGYADLSDFFYVWARRSLGAIYPELFGTLLVPKAAELVATPYRFEGSREKASHFFEEGFNSAMARVRAAQHPEYPLTVFYAFKQSESEEGEDEGSATVASTGWETMLEGLIRSAFQITGTWPMRSERPGRSISVGTNALASSILLVCRPRPQTAGVATRKEFLTVLRRELPTALRTLQQGHIAPVDLQQAAIGPGMAVFSRYAKVLESDGEPMRVRTALGLINQVLDEVLSEQEGDFDAETRWALTWFEQNGFEESEYGQAEVLATAKAVSVQAMEEHGLIRSRAGKVRLLRRDELPEEWEPTQRVTIWEATQRLIRTLEEKDEAAVAGLRQQLGPVAETARELGYRLYTLCERKGWAQEAGMYNSLVMSWHSMGVGLFQAAKA